MTTRPTGLSVACPASGHAKCPASADAGITGIGAGYRLKTRLPKRIQTTGQ